MRRRRTVRRSSGLLLALVLVAIGVSIAPPAVLAGGVDSSNGRFSAGVYNLTPYTWTLVKTVAPQSCADYVSGGGCWQAPPAATLAPGQSTVYQLAQNYQEIWQFGNSHFYGYNGWFTYRVDVAGAPAEYVTIALSQAFKDGVYGNELPALRQFITTTAPPDDYNPGRNPDPYPAPAAPDPQITYQVGVPQGFDLTYTLVGDHTIDAGTGDNAPLVKLLNALCDDAAGTSCRFDQQGPIAWTSGAAGAPYLTTNCAPPNGLPSTYKVDYTVSQSAAFSVGGGFALGVEFKLFDIAANSVTVSVEADHEWRETTSYTRTAGITVPPGDIGFLWVTPTVAKVTGTLTLTSPHSTFTVTNFSETRSGVARDDLTPAFNVSTYVRPMTSAELAVHCSDLSTAVAGGR